MGKRVTKRYEWSPQLKRQVLAHQYWKLRLKYSKGCNIPWSKLENLRASAQLPDHAQLTEQQILTFLVNSAPQLKIQQKQHKSFRAAYLEDLANAIVIMSSPHLEAPHMEHARTLHGKQRLQMLIARENSRNLFRKLGHILRGSTAN